MGYYKNLIIARQVEEPDRFRKNARRETYKAPSVVTDKRTLVTLVWLVVIFGVTSVLLTILVAWMS